MEFPSLDKEGWRVAPGWFETVGRVRRQPVTRRPKVGRSENVAGDFSKVGLRLLTRPTRAMPVPPAARLVAMRVQSAKP